MERKRTRDNHELRTVLKILFKLLVSRKVLYFSYSEILVPNYMFTKDMKFFHPNITCEANVRRAGGLLGH